VLHLLCPGGKNLLYFCWPLNLSSAAVAEFVVEENLSFAVFAEEPLLLFEPLSQGLDVRHRFTVNPKAGDMLLYVAVGSKLAIRWRVVSQHHIKSLGVG
jgi:hypothetical protein